MREHHPPCLVLLAMLAGCGGAGASDPDPAGSVVEPAAAEPAAPEADPQPLPAFAPPALTGVWQDAPAMGSGWSSVYVFRANGGYAHFPAGGCARVTERAGSYEVRGDVLTTTERWQERVIGGRELADPSGCALEGGRHERVALESPSAAAHTLGACPTDALEENDMIPCVTIDGVPHWRFSEDPTHFPDLDPVAALKRRVLCPADELSEDACRSADYEAVGVLDLHGDGRIARVFALTEGGPALCHVRAACFSIIERHPTGWRVLLRSMGSTVGPLTSANEGYRDLRVSAADTADSWTLVRHRWDPAAGRYRSAERTSCTALEEGSAEPLCRPVPSAVILQ
jgi:hypothetical protein